MKYSSLYFLLLLLSTSLQSAEDRKTESHNGQAPLLSRDRHPVLPHINGEPCGKTPKKTKRGRTHRRNRSRTVLQKELPPLPGIQGATSHGEQVNAHGFTHDWQRKIDEARDRGVDIPAPSYIAAKREKERREALNTQQDIEELVTAAATQHKSRPKLEQRRLERSQQNKSQPPAYDASHLKVKSGLFPEPTAKELAIMRRQMEEFERREAAKEAKRKASQGGFTQTISSTSVRDLSSVGLEGGDDH